ncbi:hypothetical protein XELAEV_18031222mg [Xenopus laevis]|uniref:Uncharacterized protein n=1 Tax=Xenopus laevis TaxID=8355 RepID=A0A974CM77_XENLA|nr:hypothetical protein XELAEV_18031222mg [Xenopus laevis]
MVKGASPGSCLRVCPGSLRCSMLPGSISIVFNHFALQAATVVVPRHWKSVPTLVHRGMIEGNVTAIIILIYI